MILLSSPSRLPDLIVCHKRNGVSLPWEPCLEETRSCLIINKTGPVWHPHFYCPSYVKQGICFYFYFWLISHPTVPLFEAAASWVSLSCHYRQTSHGSGVPSQRQEKGGWLGWVLSDLLFLRDRRGCSDEGGIEGARDKGRKLFPPLFGD